MRTIGVVTAARSDYGSYLPILKKIKKDPNLRLYLMVSGMHLSPGFGSTYKAIERDGFRINAKVKMLLPGDEPEGISQSMGRGVIGFAKSFARFKPDILLVLGDRFEMFAAALAALPFKIPIAHIHGGELTQGAMDDALRHSLTKLSHLHFVSTKEYARRVIHLGEEPWRVTISGAPSLDNLHLIKLLSAGDLKKKYGLSFTSPPLLVTFHPVTFEYEKTEKYVTEILRVLAELKLPVVFTAPNADTHNQIITLRLKQFIKKYSWANFIENFGTQDYFSLMAIARAMVGNSSSGIVESPSFKLPVVDIGTRQKGRVCARNVVHVGYFRKEILRGVKKAISPDFRKSLLNLENPYGDKHAAEKILNKLKKIKIDNYLIEKGFYEK